MGYVQNYYDTNSRIVVTSPGPGRIAVSAYVLRKMAESQAAGKSIACDNLGRPLDIMALMTLDGMRNAWVEELREQRIPLLNALLWVWVDAHSSGDEVLRAAVMDARNFLTVRILADADLLAVQPGTEATQGLEFMRKITLDKYKVYAIGAMPAIRAAFKEIL